MDPIDETLPEVVKNFLRKGAKLEEIRLHDDGRWTHEGLDFENPKIVELFNRSVDRTEGGTWVLVVEPFTYPIEVDDTGFFVERIEWGAPVELHLSDGTSEPLQPQTLSYREGGRLYAVVKDGRFRARFKKGPYYALAEKIEEDGGAWKVEISGKRWTIAPE